MSASGSAILVLWIAVNKQNLRLHASPVSRERVNGRALSAVIETRTLSRALLKAKIAPPKPYNCVFLPKFTAFLPCVGSEKCYGVAPLSFKRYAIVAPQPPASGGASVKRSTKGVRASTERTISR